MRIEVKLPKGRAFPGTLSAFAENGDGTEKCVFGPVPCLGRADAYAAAQHGNPGRNPLRPYGDTPVGSYDCTLLSPGDNLRSYGPHGRIALRATAGDALAAANSGVDADPDDGHRSGLLIHGGAPGPRGGLRPTHGCLRLSDENMAALLAVFKEPCTCTVSEIPQSGPISS